MKIQSKLPFNTKLSASHCLIGSIEDNAALLVGSALPNILRIPAGSTIELADAEWKQYEKAAKGYLEKGSLVYLVAPKLDPVQQDMSDAKLEASLKKQMAELKARRVKEKEASAKEV